MRNIPLDDIRVRVSVALKTLSKPAKRHVGMDAFYEKEIEDTVMQQLERCVVVAPDMVGWGTSTRHGTFGIDEPHPFPKLGAPPVRR